MYVVKMFKLQYLYVDGLIFQAGVNENNFKFIKNCFHIAGGQVDLGPRGVHHVGGEVVEKHSMYMFIV